MGQNSVKSVAVIGLGSMGMGAAKSCIRAGLDVYGIDLNPVALEDLGNAGAKGVSTDANQFAQNLDAVLLLVINAKQVKSVLFDSGLAANLKPLTPVMVSATISAQDAKEIEAMLKTYNLLMLDAPVSGGALKANAGEMTIMAS
ncbi:NAD(P)-binding domain-containing protein, partial [Vibrio cholerae]|nr:NAD(P)-binding domain-containing protein [Vibrio cholerae]